MAEKQKSIIAGLESAEIQNLENNPAEEYDLVKSLLEAADYRNNENVITPVDIKRAGKFLFTVNIHPVGDQEVKAARKRATVMMPNPNNKKLPPIEKDFKSGLFNSLIIYAATTDEDKVKIWGNKAIMDTYSLVEPHESIDVLLTAGEKAWLSDLVVDISGMNEDEVEVTKEEHVKN